MKNLRSIAILANAITPHFSGQNGLTYDLVQHLKKKYQLTLYCQQVSHDLQNDPRIHWIKTPKPWGPAIVGFVFSPLLLSLRLIFERKNYDLICSTGALSLIFDINIVHLLHGGLRQAQKELNFKTGLYQNLTITLNCLIEKLLYQKDRHYIAVSHKINRELKKIYKIQHVTTLWNTLTAHRTVPTLPRKTSHPKIKLPVKLLFVGDVNRNIKNLETLIAALKMMPKEQYLLQICTTAKPKPWNNIDQKLAPLNYEFLGKRENMLPVYRQSHILVHPSIYESFGLVILEAYRCGLKIICASKKYVGLAALIENKLGVWTLENPMDVKSLHQKIIQAINAPWVARAPLEHSSSQQLQAHYENVFVTVYHKKIKIKKLA